MQLCRNSIYSILDVEADACQFFKCSVECLAIGGNWRKKPGIAPNSMQRCGRSFAWWQCSWTNSCRWRWSRDYRAAWGSGVENMNINDLIESTLPSIGFILQRSREWGLTFKSAEVELIGWYQGIQIDIPLQSNNHSLGLEILNTL